MGDDIGRLEEAKVLFKEASEFFATQLGQDHPRVKWLNMNLANTKYNLACLESLEGNFDTALELLRQCGAHGWHFLSSPSWHWEDDDLEPLREARKDDFEAAVGPQPVDD